MVVTIVIDFFGNGTPGLEKMADKGILKGKNRSFSLHLLVAMIVLVVIVVGLVAVNDYYNTKNMFERNSQHLQRQTE
jgi:hypothetical protein